MSSSSQHPADGDDSPQTDALGGGPVSSEAATSPAVYPKGLAWTVIAVLLAILPVAWLGLKEIRLKNDVESWLPADDPDKIKLNWVHEHFEARDRMLVSWTTSSLDDPRVAAFAAEVIKRQDVEAAVTPQTLIDRMVENKIDRDEATRRLEGVLVGTGLLKVKLTELGRSRRDALIKDMRTKAEQAFDFPLTITPAPMLESDESDRLDESADPAFDLQIEWPGIQPGGQRDVAVREWIGTLEAAAGDERSPLVESVFFAPGAPVAVSVTVAEAAHKRLRATIESIRQAAYDVGVPQEELRMGGSPVAGAGLNDNVISAGFNRDMLAAIRAGRQPWYMLPKVSPAGFTLLVGVVLAFVMLRSIRLAVLVLAVAIYTTLITLALVPPTGGSMSLVLVVMPSLLLVLTMSGAIHVANYWRHAANELDAEFAGPVPKGAAILRAAKQAAGPCALASFTTSIGLASLTTSPLVPVRDFGLYSAIGCVLSLGMVLIAFPALLRVWPGKAGKESDDERDRWGRIGRWINAHGTAVAVVCLTIMLAGAAGLHRFATETKVIRYFPDDSEIVRDYEFLENNLAGIVPVTTIVGFQGDGWGNGDLHDQLELVDRLESNLADHPEISGTLALPDFLPEVDPEMNRFKASRFKRNIFDAVRDEVEGNASREESTEVAESEDSSEFVARVRTPLRIPGEKAAIFSPPPVGEEDERVAMGREIYKITAQVSILTDLDYGPFLDQVDQIVRDTIAEWEVDQAEKAGGPVEGESPADRRVEYIVTGTVPLFLRTQEAVLESLIISFGLAFGVIAVVMMIILKSPIAGLITMIPNLLPVGLVFGLISWAGIAVDIGTMITASVALGVAVDGTLHLLTWFRQRLGQGATAGQAIGAGLSHCGPAMFQTSTVVALGLMCLMFSDLLLISRFGWLMAALITAALFADLVFLPSLLAGKLGRVIERRALGDASPETPVATDPPPATEQPGEAA